MTKEVTVTEGPVKVSKRPRPGAMLAAVLTAMAGVLIVLIGDKVVTTVSRSGFPVGSLRLKQDGLVFILFGGLIVLGLVGALLARRAGGRALAAGLTALAAALVAFLLLGLRVDDDFGKGVDVAFSTGGWMLVGAFVLLVAALIAYLVTGSRFSESKHGTKALLVGLLSLVLLPLAPAAVILGTSDRGEGGKRSGKGTAGILLGILALVLWLGGLGLGALLAKP